MSGQDTIRRIELMGADVSGIAVHIGARVSALATRRDPRFRHGEGPRRRIGIEFDDRGEHSLKGVPGEWRLFALRL